MNRKPGDPVWGVERNGKLLIDSIDGGVVILSRRHHARRYVRRWKRLGGSGSLRVVKLYLVREKITEAPGDE